jgi:glycosyltransferase involved in cell wall biosynthesis
VAGEAAILLEDAAPHGLAAALESLESDAARRALVGGGLVQARKFSWPDAAARYFALYSRVRSDGKSHLGAEIKE